MAGDRNRAAVAAGERRRRRPPEPRLRFAGGIAHLEIPSPTRWQRDFAGADVEPERAARGYAAYEARLRQFAAVLGAHAIDVVFDYVDA